MSKKKMIAWLEQFIEHKFWERELVCYSRKYACDRRIDKLSIALQSVCKHEGGFKFEADVSKHTIDIPPICKKTCLVCGKEFILDGEIYIKELKNSLMEENKP